MSMQVPPCVYIMINEGKVWDLYSLMWYVWYKNTSSITDERQNGFLKKISNLL